MGVVVLLTMFLSPFSTDIYDPMEMNFGERREVLVNHGTKHNNFSQFLHRCYA